MSHWICCNSCFQAPSPDRKLAVTTCGHIICSVCFQKGKQGECMICKAKCQVSPLSDKSSTEVKALFSDINSVATKHFTEISKVLLFQARHQRRLMAHHQQRNEKLEDALRRMRQEMQQMSKKLTEQSAYIAKLENTLQHQSTKLTPSTKLSHSSHNLCGSKSVLQIPYSSPMSLSRYSSTPSLVDHMEVDRKSAFRKPETSAGVPRLSLISPPQDGRIDGQSDQSGNPQRDTSVCSGTTSYRSANQKTLVNHSASSANVSRQQELQMTPDLLYRSAVWETPVFKPSSAFRYSSQSSLVLPSLGASCPPP